MLVNLLSRFTHSRLKWGLGIGFLLVVQASLFSHRLFSEDLNPRDLKFFETKIRPVLVKNCYSCHSAKAGKTKGELALDTREGIRAGGESGHGVVPGDLQASLILDAIKYESFEMPPKKQLPLSVVRDFERWIKMGAPDPRIGKSIVKNKSSIDFEEGRKFWAFRKPQASPPPKVNDPDGWSQSDIDLFVLAKLNEAGLTPVGPASVEQLLRRDYLNLTGLPPTQKEIDDYLTDEDADRREKLIERLLKSKKYGEKWGRHWLDVARFAESNGRERNFLYPHAWRYRNYVIDSFNNDKSYQRFITEQLAGDLIQPLENQPPFEPKIATGFLAVGPKLLNERNKEVFSMDMVDEQIDVVSRSTMAITVSCARCHDHKFDPVSTEDYYALAGIFRSTETLFGRGGNGSRQATGLINVQVDPGDDGKTASLQKEKEIAKLAAELKRLRMSIQNQQKSLAKKQGQSDKKNQSQSRPTAADKKLIQRELAKQRKRQKVLQQQLNVLRNNGVGSGEVAMGVREGKCLDCNILIRGEITGKGEIVKRGFLTVMSQSNRFQVADKASSGRLELAKWIASKDNPLTARVAVNRIWRHLFGQGLVRTVDNFGETGERPSHPQLLDYLANRFVDNGWSFKELIREIMLSRAYQSAIAFDSDNFESDPGNRLLWRMNSRRLDAEILRDSILLAAGVLNGEAPVKSPVAKYKSSQGIGRGVTEETFNVEYPYRSVYLPVVRNAIPESLRVFDFAEPSILVGDRQVTTVATQALYMMNSKFVMKNSQLLASRIQKPGASEVDQIKRAYRAVLSRLPQQKEIRRAEEFIGSSRKKLLNQNKSEADANEIAFAAFCQALFASGEFRILN
jgi:cytochrome c553